MVRKYEQPHKLARKLDSNRRFGPGSGKEAGHRDGMRGVDVRRHVILPAGGFSSPASATVVNNQQLAKITSFLWAHVYSQTNYILADRIRSYFGQRPLQVRDFTNILKCPAPTSHFRLVAGCPQRPS